MDFKKKVNPEDIAVLCLDVCALFKMTENLEREPGKMGLKINLRKTKVMALQLREDLKVELVGEVNKKVN